MKRVFLIYGSHHNWKLRVLADINQADAWAGFHRYPEGVGHVLYPDAFQAYRRGLLEYLREGDKKFAKQGHPVPRKHTRCVPYGPKTAGIEGYACSQTRNGLTIYASEWDKQDNFWDDNQDWSYKNPEEVNTEVRPYVWLLDLEEADERAAA